MMGLLFPSALFSGNVMGKLVSGSNDIDGHFSFSSVGDSGYTARY